MKERAAAATLQWDSYQEDIKSQIGAREAAQWQGAPVYARLTETGVEIRFEVGGPWDGYDAAMPILLRGPSAKVYREVRNECRGAEHIYAFDLRSEAETGAIPWIEIQFPHSTQRISLINGEWNAAE